MTASCSFSRAIGNRAASAGSTCTCRAESTRGALVHGGTWSPPTNLGPMVNGPDDEVGPPTSSTRAAPRSSTSRAAAAASTTSRSASWAPTGGPGRRSSSAPEHPGERGPADDPRRWARDRLPLEPPAVGRAWPTSGCPPARNSVSPGHPRTLNLGALVNSTRIEQQAWLSDSADELYFASNRPPGVQGDIWLSTRKLRRE